MMIPKVSRPSPKPKRTTRSRLGATPSMLDATEAVHREVRMVAIKDIVIPPHREPDPATVHQLAASIAEVDLLNPIILTPEGELVTGRNRIAAFVELGRTHIPARTATWGMLERELAEIDENIVRRRFSVLERGRLLARKKELYEAVHPEARQHARGGHAKAAAEAATEIISVAPAFASDAADKLGTSERSVREEIRIATELAPRAAKLLCGTPLEDEKVLLMQLTRLPREQQVSVTQLLVDGRTKSVKSAVAMLEGDARATERKNLRSRKGGESTARMREITGSLHEVGKRWGRLVHDLDPALAQEAQEIGIALEKIEERIRALVRSVAEPAAEPSGHGEAQTCRDEHAPTTPLHDLSRRILAAKNRFSERHGGLLDGSLTLADYMAARRGDPESVRATKALLASDLFTLVREVNSFSIEVPGTRPGPTLGHVNGSGSAAPAPAGPSRTLPPLGSTLTPLPPANATSAPAPSKVVLHNPMEEEIEAVVVQIIEGYRSGVLRLPFQGRAEIWRKNWPAHVREAASEKFFAMLDALHASVRAAPQSASNTTALSAAPAEAELSPLSAQTAQPQKAIFARPDASNSLDPTTPRMGDLARAAALVLAAPGSSHALTIAARLVRADTDPREERRSARPNLSQPRTQLTTRAASA
ncbi:ParB/RepB/Spo0J family partition protein [Sorangium sp. So ce145]|uniref:ParB/RepB/Spo0J family partition protein n=1 Tax=Sorangium sp. So ce145 TaxID=3133285 RepID=UPI003F5D97C8